VYATGASNTLVETNRYDGMGRPYQVTRCQDEGCYSMGMSYDPAGREKQLTYPDGEVVTYSYDDAGRLSSAVPYVDSLQYSSTNQLVSEWFGNDTSLTNTYDPQRLWLNTAAVTNNAGASLYSASYTHDPAARLCSQTITNPTAVTTAFKYDSLNRLVDASSTTDPSLNQSWTYNEIGNMTFNSKVGPYRYDATHHVHALTTTGGITALTFEWLSTACSATWLNGDYIRFYVNGSLVASPAADTSCACVPTAGIRSVTITDPAALALVVNGNNTFMVEYPGANQYLAWAQVNVVGGSGWTVIYDANGQTTQQTRTNVCSPTPGYAYNPGTQSRNVSVSAPVYGYDQDGNLTSGRNLALTWTNDNMPATIQNFANGQTTRYFYDASGQRVAKAQGSNTTRYFGKHIELSPSGAMTKYYYAGNQLVAKRDASGVCGAVTFQWLATPCSGNPDILFYFNGDHLALRTPVDDVPASCACTPGIRSVTVTDPAVISELSNGNNSYRFSVVIYTPNTANPDPNVALAWAKVIINGVTTVIYDANGGSDAINNSTNLCDPSVGYTYATPWTVGPATNVFCNATQYYHQDVLGSTRLTSDAIGNPIATSRVNYAPYGNPTLGQRFGYTGQESDDESGLIYMDARYYEPLIGRILSPDTVVPDLTKPQSLNRYSYVLNNPLSMVDPTGHQAENTEVTSDTRWETGPEPGTVRAPIPQYDRSDISLLSLRTEHFSLLNEVPNDVPEVYSEAWDKGWGRIQSDPFYEGYLKTPYTWSEYKFLVSGTAYASISPLDFLPIGGAAGRTAALLKGGEASGVASGGRHVLRATLIDKSGNIVSEFSELSGNAYGLFGHTEVQVAQKLWRVLGPGDTVLLQGAYPVCSYGLCHTSLSSLARITGADVLYYAPASGGFSLRTYMGFRGFTPK